MIRVSAFALASLLLAAPAIAQPTDHSKMPGMGMPAVAAPAPSTAAPHADHSIPGAQPAAAAEPAIPDTPPPPEPADHAAERFYAPEVMAASRAQLRREHGGGRYSQVMARFVEYQVRNSDDGYRWDVEAWYGGDINRFVLKAEGEGGLREGVDEAEVQTLYSRSVGPYFDIHVGLRYDFEPDQRTYATLGFEGLAPYWFEVEGAAFLSDQGDLSARFEATYDLRLTQKLILQPFAELNLALQDIPAAGTGSGLSDVELSFRLRYEVRKEFAPYIGVSWQRKFGGSADFARAAGESISSTSVVVGLRGWF